eukprot:gb/GFBE01023139.1/.p1 GENE.gb/GFBE01023139.1/~~gb/GFBE01023139.1/.p1  ORF type:complete len:175 (+),score=41.82 gb/GFBE01023139.1/:1-525(+)
MGRGRDGKGSGKEDGKSIGKAFKEGLANLEKKTAVRVGDLDEKAWKYLEYVQENGGRGNEALLYLAEALEGRSRDQVSNWKAYAYSLLRTFDEEAYKEIKASEGRKVRPARSSLRGASKEKQGPLQPFNFNADAAEFVPSFGYNFNANAPEFVPQAPAADAAKSDGVEKKDEKS